MRPVIFVTLMLIASSGCTAAGEPAGETPATREYYQLEYALSLDPLAIEASASVRVRQTRHLLREARFRLDGERWTGFSGDGEILERDGLLIWRPPEAGGRLRWDVRLDHSREGGFDARLAADWALFRGEDAFPAAATRTLVGAVSQSSLKVTVPKAWSVVTPFPLEEGRFRIANPDRRFDRPTGWIVAGELGVRRDRIAGVRVAVAGPADQGVRRLDMLALLNWTLPSMKRALGGFPDRLTIVSAGDPMWRGALSAPSSIYVHAERPLLSENGTSTLVHELMHVGLGRQAASGQDWILEGLAEFYSVEILRRTRTVTAARHEDTLRSLARWGREADTLRRRHSTGPVTARAVGVFHALDTEIREASGGKRNLDDVLRRLAGGHGRLDLAELRAAAAREIGEPSKTLASSGFRRLVDDE